MPTEPSNRVLKRSRAGATTVSSPVESLRDTERKGRSRPFTEARWPFNAWIAALLCQLPPFKPLSHLTEGQDKRHTEKKHSIMWVIDQRLVIARTIAVLCL